MDGLERLSPSASGSDVLARRNRSLEAPATAFRAAEKTRAELERALAAAEARIEALEGVVASHEEEREGVRAGQRRLAEVADNLPGIIFRRVLRPDGEITYEHVAGQSHAKSYGIDMPEGREDLDRVFSRVHPDDRDALRSAILRSAANLTPMDFVYRKTTAGTEVRWERVTGRARPLANGDIVWD
jgi:hypothetical protein